MTETKTFSNGVSIVDVALGSVGEGLFEALDYFAIDSHTAKGVILRW